MTDIHITRKGADEGIEITTSVGGMKSMEKI